MASSNTALIEVAAVSGQDGYMTPLSTPNPDSDFSYDELYNPYVSEYSVSIKSARIIVRSVPQGITDFGGTSSLYIERLGSELVTGITFQCILPELVMNKGPDPEDPQGPEIYLNKVRWMPNPGHNIIDHTYINIGTNTIEKQTSKWMDIVSSFRLKTENAKRSYNTIIGQQNLEIINIGNEDLNKVTYLTRDDIQIIEINEALTATTTPANDLPAGTRLIAMADPNVAPPVGPPTSVPYDPENIGQLQEEGVVTHGYNGLQTYKTYHPPTKINTCYKFWFCDKPHLALPVISMSLQHVEVTTIFRRFDQCIEYKDKAAATTPEGSIRDATNKHLSEATYYVNCIFVDPRTRQAYTVLRTQVMIQIVDCRNVIEINNTSKDISINSSHPSDELLWIIQDARSLEVNDYTNYYIYNSDGITKKQPLVSAELLFQGNSRSSERGWEFYRHYMQLISHENPTDLNVYVYSFSLDPEAYQFTCTANFSRIDNITLTLKLDPVYENERARVSIFNLHRNFLRIARAPGGKIFAS